MKILNKKTLFSFLFTGFPSGHAYPPAAPAPDVSSISRLVGEDNPKICNKSNNNENHIKCNNYYLCQYCFKRENIHNKCNELLLEAKWCEQNIKKIYWVKCRCERVHEFTIFGKNFFDATDFLTSQIMLPLGGIFIAIFVGWIMKKEHVLDGLGFKEDFIFKAWYFSIRYIAPTLVGLVFLNFFIDLEKFYNLLF